VRVIFDEQMDPTTFDPSDIDSFTGPGGSIAVTAVTPVSGTNNTQFDISFAQQITLGHYTMVMGPDIRDTMGRQMDQNGNGIPGEIPDDEYTARFTLQGAKILSSTPTGNANIPGSVTSLRVTFNQPMDPNSFGPGGVVLTGPGGTIPATSVTPVAGSNNTQFDINVTALGTTGVYHLTVGPHISNPFGVEMDQNGNFIPGEDPGDAYTAMFGVLGPRITSSSPTTVFDLFPVDHVQVIFNESMDPATFTPDKIASFTGPNGPITVTNVVPEAGSNNTRFDIQFAAQNTDGAYHMVIGPDIRDPFNNQMDQNGNLIPGEIPGDQYTANFTILPTPPPVGPDGFGYRAFVIQGVNRDIVGLPGTFTIIAAADDLSVPVDLGSNTFNFYGHTYTGNNQLFVSSNGLITFGSANAEYVNTDLSGGDPAQAAIAALWDDWIKSPGDPSGPMVVGKFATVLGLPALVIEWNQVQHFGGGAGRHTFQAVLGLNTGTAAGDFGMNFVNLESGDIYADGASATVGSKDVGNQGPNRLLVSFNNGSSPYVHTGQALRFSTNNPPSLSREDLFTAPLPNAAVRPSSVGSAATPAILSSKQAPAATSPMDQYFATAPAGRQPLTLASAGDDATTVAAGLQDPLTPLATKDAWTL
jgi:hypothetical protein